MDEETVRAGPIELWLTPRLDPIRALWSRYRTAIITAAFFGVAFLVYRLLGPPETVYNNFVRLADAFLHGRVDLPDAPDLTYIEFAIREGKYYIIPPPWPAIVLLPGVALFGLALNQTLVSAVLGAINASVVYNVTRNVTQKLSTQVWLSVLFIFGTIYWFAAANGGVWFFSHTVAVLFLFLAIYVTLVKKNPFWAGLFLGAAYWSRQMTVLSLPFFIIMFSDMWLPPAADGSRKWDLKSIRQRIDLMPLAQLAIGLGIFVIASFAYNYLRFATPLDASEHYLPERDREAPWFNNGIFHYSYIPRHIGVLFESQPIVQTSAPYVLPSWGGMALWMTTPAFFYAFFAGIRRRSVIVISLLLILAATAIIISRGVARAWDLDWSSYYIPYRMHLWPFALLIVQAIYFGWRDKFVLACWSAILPVAFGLFFFGATGFSQFGYRFGLDFLPFLFLLTIRGMGGELRWHNKLLIIVSVLVNLWGVLWIYQFEPHQFQGLQWVRF